MRTVFEVSLITFATANQLKRTDYSPVHVSSQDECGPDFIFSQELCACLPLERSCSSSPQCVEPTPIVDPLSQICECID